MQKKNWLLIATFVYLIAILLRFYYPFVLGEFEEYFYHKSLILMADDERICRMRQEERGDLALNDQCRAFSDAFMNLILATADSLVEAPSHSPLAALI